ncbi:MAG TPA: ornithine--oxo-acid transaminase [Solirubrobacteraceae bacterium]|nr:ornithine--oxo-acid transaminase [Solirubrobacteraceae bacterium]
MRHELSWGRHYLMCPPTFFDVTYAINPWMDLAVVVDRERAQRQWDALVQTLREAGATLDMLDPQPALPDLVFTANLGLVDGETFVPARMRHPERRPEAAHAEAWFRARGHDIRRLGDDVVQEGAGDALPFRGTLLAGHRTRSSASAYVELARLVDGAILPLELADERFYHVDIAFCPLDSESALVAPAALDAGGLRAIEKLVPDPILLTEDEARAFCANAVVVGRTVVMPACTPRLELELRERDLQPVVVDVSEFLKAGGGPRCLTLALDTRLGHEDTAAVAERHTAHNYHPLPVTVTHADGVWVHDDRGRRYLDALSAYSALNFGHRHPRLVAAARDQLDRVTLTSRAFSNDQFGPFARDLAALCGKDRVLPMNTGAEAVETAIKTARKWGYEVKGVAPGRATILVCDGNFHGRTTTIVSFSADPLARDGFGPFTPGFRRVPFGDATALAAALAADPDVVGFLVEPVQGEAGVIVPPAGYLREARRLCSEHGVLLIADEIQSGLGRTGRTFACDHEGVVPDIYVLGKALGGGIVALSAIAADDEILGVFVPGSHGSTFGGNPLACAVGRAVLDLLSTGEPQANAARLGMRLRTALDAAAPAALGEVRSLGLWFGLDVHPRDPRSARDVCEGLLAAGVLAKDTHERTIRLAPPLTITPAEADWMLERLVAVLDASDRLRLVPPPPGPASFAA